MNPILSPDQYSSVSTYDLLCAAEQGFVGVDHRLLHALVDAPEKTVSDLARFAMEQRQDARESLSEDLTQIFRHLRAKESVPFLMAQLRRNHEDATVDLISAFQAVGAATVEPLLAFYEEVKAKDSSDAGFVLASVGVRDPRILGVLVDRLKIDPVDAGHCLAAYGDPAAIPAIRETIERVKGEEWMVRSLQFCVEELESGKRAGEDEPFDLWALYPDETDPRFDLLTEKETELFLESTDKDNRFAAVAVLSEQETPKRLWDKLLKMARADSDTVVRGECWQALIDGWDRADIRKAMHAVLADESASFEERSGALRSLAGREGEKPEVRKWMLSFYEQPSTRAAAMQAMAISQDPRYAEQFRERLEDPSGEVAGQAMLGVAMLGLEDAAPRLIPYFKNEDLRSEALPAYAMCAECEPTRAGLQGLYKKIDELAVGLSADEEMAVKSALNTRAEREGGDPVFGDDGEVLLDEPLASEVKVGRNDPCPCGSGKKYKKCCGGA